MSSSNGINIKVVQEKRVSFYFKISYMLRNFAVTITIVNFNDYHIR